MGGAGFRPPGSCGLSGNRLESTAVGLYVHRQLPSLWWALALGAFATAAFAQADAVPPALIAAPSPAPIPAPIPSTSTPRVVSLSAADVSVTAGEQVQFLDQSSGDPTSWTWDFSYDGVQPIADSADQNPLWTFAARGVYTVRLEACNAGGCSAAVHPVTVTQCTSDLDLVLPGLLPLPFITSSTYEACHTITTTGVLPIVLPGRVVFRAGRSIAFGSGFSVGAGASFEAVIDPLLDTP